MMSSSDDNENFADENVRDEGEEEDDGENGEGGQDLEWFTNNDSSSGEAANAH